MSALVTLPKVPLGPALDRVCDLIRDHSDVADQRLLCQRLRTFLESNNYSADQVAEYLRSAYPKPAGDDWLLFFRQRQTFADQESEAEIETGTQTALQDPHTVLQPDKIVQTQPTVNPAAELAGRSVMVCGRSANAVSDVLRAIAKELMVVHPSVAFKIVSLQAEPWLGFQSDSGIVSYTSLGVLSELVQAVEAIRSVWAVYVQKGKEAQAAVRAYRERKPSHPVCLVISQWDLLFKWVKALDTSQLKEYNSLAYAAKVKLPMTPARALNCVKHMAAGGPGLGVFCVLGAQQATERATGFGPEILSTIAIAAIGCAEHGYGYMDAIAQQSDTSVRDDVRTVANRIRIARKVGIATTDGVGAVYELPEYSDLRNRTAVPIYQHSVSKALKP